MKQNMKKIYVGCIILALVLLLGGAAWLILRKNQPTQGEQVAKNSLGVEWYDEDGTEFTISTVEEFYEFADLAYVYDFEGQTIKLGADLVLNEGNAEDWLEEDPENIWESIYGFAGTFDGQGHTISGIYSMGYLYQSAKRGNGTDYVTSGLFRNTQESCVIKNFKLLNSCFISDLNYGVGSISSNGGGTFESIYTDAIIFSQKRYVGGIIGRVTENTNVTNCWFDGSIDIVANYGRYDGGIAGRVEEGKDLTIEHCLVSATLTSDLYKKGVNMGGMVGTTHTNVTVTINDSLVSGKVIPNWTSVVGSVIGNLVDKTTLKASNVYVTSDTYKKIVGYHAGTMEGSPIALDREVISGYGGYQWTTLDFENYWAAVEGGTPILKTFATDELSLEGVEKKVDISWYDAEKDTYILEDAADLYGFALMSYQTDFEGKTVNLGADITVNEGKASNWAKEAPENGWITIGSSNSKFAGTFDGKGKTISGIYLKTEESYQGMFGTTAETAVIKNFKLKNSYFESSNNSFGSIAGRGVGTFDSIYSDAIVVGSMSNIGGIIGQVTSGNVTVNNCWFDGKVTNTAKSEGRRTGGIIGCVFTQAKVTNCLNTGTIDVSAYKAGEVSSSTGKETKNVYPYAGGMIGYIKVTDKKYTNTISNCFNAGNVLVYQDPKNVKVVSRYGSILGYANKSYTTVADCYATTESCNRTASGNSEYLTGKVITYPEAKLKGYGGYQWTTLDFAKYWSVVLGPDGTPILKKFAGKSPSVVGITRMLDTSWYNEKESTYVLYDVADLNGFALLSGTKDFAGKTVKLGADITINTGNAADWAKTAPAYEWLGIGSNSRPFAGTFDGQMHTISGVYLKTDAQYSGLFGATSEKAVVKNFSLKNSYFESSHNSFGSIVGRGEGTFDTIYSDAIVVGSMANIGGMIGQVPTSGGVTMTNCWYDGTVTNTAAKDYRRTGGLVGCVYADSTFTNCLNSGTVDVTAFSKREVSSSTGKETSNIYPYAGGLVGYVRYAKNVKLSDCMNTGDVLVYTDPNGKLNVSRYGSVLGYTNGTTVAIEDSYATSESSKYSANGSSKYMSGQVIVYDEETLNGYGGYQWTTLDFAKYWAVVLNPDESPILKSFATSTPSITVARMIDMEWYTKNPSANTYTISDMDDLYGFALLSGTNDFKGKTVQLGADITVNTGNASDWATNAPEYSWLTIGSASLPFAGTFDGNGKSISGLYLNTEEQYKGLFGVTDEAAVIKNFSLLNSYFESSNNSFGSIAGRGTGTFTSIKSDAIVVGSMSNVGGLIGQVTSGSATLTDCWFAGSVTNTSNATSGRRTGGLVGCVFSSVAISNCLNTGTVDVSVYKAKEGSTSNIYPYAGGLIGYIKTTDSSSVSEISGCLNTGDVLVSDSANVTRYGSVMGYANASKTTISDTYATNESCANTANGSSSYMTGTVLAFPEDTISGYGGYQWTTLNFAEAEGYWAVVTSPDETPILQTFAKSVPSLEGYAKMFDISWYDANSDKPYEIKDKEDLYGLAVLSSTTNFAGKTIELKDNITINSGAISAWGDSPLSWISIGSSKAFAGTFEGNGKTISGLYSVSGSENGLFAATAAGSTVRNFRLENSYFEFTGSDATAIGSVVGTLGGNLDSVYSSAEVTSKRGRTGGLVGVTDPGEEGVNNITNCWFEGSVTEDRSDKNSANYEGLAGIVGYVAQGTVNMSNCLNSADITYKVIKQQSYHVSIAGVVGYVASAGTLNMDQCVNTGKFELVCNTLSNNPRVCGLVGHNAGIVKAENSYSIKIHDTYSYSNGLVKGGTPADTCKLSETATDLTTIAAQTKTENLSYYHADKNPNGAWVITADGPALVKFVDEWIDMAWYYDTKNYDVGNNTFTISTAEELYGLSAIAETYSFENDTINLTKSVVMNSGNATDWANGQTTDVRVWTPIGNKTYPFKGTFNANGKTISGVYMTTDELNAGLFGYLAGGTIQNIRLENSFFESTIEGTESSLGSILGQGYGNITNVYSSALVYSIGTRNGGLVGSAGTTSSATTTLYLTSCQFDGTLKLTQVNKSTVQSGGMVGYGRHVTFDTCLNTGTVKADRMPTSGTASGNCTIGVGGFIGAMNGSTNAVIKNSVNASEVQLNWHANTIDTAPNAFQQYGTLVGTKNSKTTASNTYNAGKVVVTIYNASAPGNGTRYDDQHISNAGAGTALNGVTNYSGDQTKLHGSKAEDLWFEGETRTDGGTAYWAQTGDATLPIPATLKKED